MSSLTHHIDPKKGLPAEGSGAPPRPRVQPAGISWAPAPWLTHHLRTAAWDSGQVQGAYSPLPCPKGAIYFIPMDSKADF